MNNIEQLLTELWAKDVKVWAEDGQLRVSAPKGVLTPALRAELSASKAELISALRQGNGSAHAHQKPICPVSHVQPLPLSFNQQRLWVMEQLHNSSAYNQFGALRLEGELNVTALAQSLTEIVRRHAILRTIFPEQNGTPVQVIQPAGPVALPLIDLMQLDPDIRGRRLQQLAMAEAQQPFDLAAGPMLRAKLLRLEPQSHVLLFTAHHICGDGWSGGVLSRELTMLYTAYVRGAASPLPELPIQYADYAVWQRQQLDDAASAAQLAYWQQQLAGLPPLLELPVDHPRPPVQSFCGALHRFECSLALAQKLKALGNRCQTTPFMTGLTAFAILLARYSRTDDIVIGTLIANRNRPELEELVGFFANTLVLRADLSGEPTVLELLARVRRMTLEAFDHQELPFEKLVEELRPERSLSFNPIFQVLFTWQQNSTLAPVDLPGLTIIPLDVHTGTAKFDLHLNLCDSPSGGLKGELEYNTDLFDAATITRMAGHLQVLLEGMVADPEMPVSKLNLLTANEERQLRVNSNDSQATFAHDKCLHQLFAEQAACTPDAIAVVYEDQVLQYGELNRRANQLAHYLQARGVGPETLVGLCIERSLEMAVGVLGILKAGGAYLPLDPAYPPERLAFTLTDAQAKIVLTQQQLHELVALDGVELICLDSDWAEHIAHESTEEPANETTPDNLAYVIYTSGSTGKPKGALVTHTNVTRLFTATDAWYGFAAGDVWTLFHSIAFDFSVWELWGALLYGGRLVIVPYWVSRSPEAFYELLHREGVTVLNQTPSAFRQLSHAEERVGVAEHLALRYVIFGGEALELASLQPWYERHDDHSPLLVNMYGITETTVHVTYRPLTRADVDSPGSMIGRPIPDLQVYILDANRRLAPIGVPGEMYVGGAGVARGYLNRPELTAERFIANPFGAGALYKSGDLARHLANGDIEYLGRIDFQVKIRGFRIELGEIENVLAKHPAVRANVVLARTDQDDHKQLVGYIVPQSGHSVTTGELQQFCRQQMPEYMVPAAFVLLDALPLTTNGKIDRRALPAPNQEQRTLSDNFVAPRTREEELLAGIWAEVLGLDRVGIHDNYFELGGDSILSTQVIAKAKALGLTLSLPQLFQHQTIEELARIATSSAPVAPQPTVAPLALLSLADREKLPATVEDAYPLTALQAGMVFHTEQAPDRPVYHDVFSYHLRAPFDQQKLQATLEHLGQCHAVLRTSFALIGFSQPLQLVHPIVRIPLQVEDWRGMSSAEQDAALNEHVQAEARRPFDWSSPPFVRFQLHRRSDDTFNLTISFHHAILDGWSFASLLTDFYQHYYFLLGQKLPPVEPPVLHYREFVALERASANSEEQRAYWLNQLRDHQRAALPRWPQASRTKAGVQSIPIRVPTDLADRLTQLAQLARVPLKSLFLAAHMRVMSVLHNEEDIVTGIALQGRPEALDSEQVKGLFLNTVPFRLKLSGGSWLDLVRATFQAEQASIPFQRFPLAEVQKALGGQPLFETLCFTVHFHVYERLQQLNDFAVLGEKFVQQTNFPLVIGFMQDPLSARLTLVGLDYDPSQFCEAQIRAIGDYHMQALAAMVADPTGKYEDLSLLSPIERQQLLVDWNHTQTVYPQEQTIHALFTAQAERTPAAIALLFAGQPLTYLELEQRANQLARYLQARGVGPEVLVGLCVERSPEMIIAQLAILKAGGAYVPLDPTYPTERLALMLEDTQVKLLLTQAQLAANLPAGPAELIALDSEWPAIAAQPATPLAVAGSPDSLAYVMYTSGSTGQPKGVCIPHRGVVRLVKAVDYVDLSPAETLLQLAPFTFDAATFEIWGALLNGARLVIMPPAPPSLQEIGAAIRRHQVTTLWLTAGLFHALVDEQIEDLVSVRQLLAGGDVLSPAHVRKACQALPACQVINGYGPTENTTFTTCYTVTDSDEFDGSVPIGRPIANTQVYLLDRHGQPVPIGVAGELYIGGAGLARGYLNRPELTAERFIANPFGAGRLYKTGDLVRYLADGQIEFLGRLDDQVKIRGFRVEPGEIEAALSQHLTIRQVAVILLEDQPGHKRLVAYYVAQPGQTPTPEQLRFFLRAKVPDYMMPAAFVRLEGLPLTANGKIDRRNLASLTASQNEEPYQFVAPRNGTERRLTAIWSDMLNHKQIGVRDDFFELGGDSLLVLRLQAAIEHQFQADLSFTTLFQNSSIEQLAVVLGQNGGEANGGPGAWPVIPATLSAGT